MSNPIKEKKAIVKTNPSLEEEPTNNWTYIAIINIGPDLPPPCCLIRNWIYGIKYLSIMFST